MNSKSWKFALALLPIIGSVAHGQWVLLVNSDAARGMTNLAATASAPNLTVLDCKVYNAPENVGHPAKDFIEAHPQFGIATFPTLVNSAFMMQFAVGPSQTLATAKTKLTKQFHDSKSQDRIDAEHEYFGIATNIAAFAGITNDVRNLRPRAVARMLSAPMKTNATVAAWLTRLNTLAIELHSCAVEDEGKRGGDPAAWSGVSFTGDQW